MEQVRDDVETTPGLTAKDFRKVAPNGFGNPYNSYAHSMIWFQNHLYVGTTRANLAYRGKWHAYQNPEWLGEIWPVKIPEGLFDIDLRAEIWRYHPPTDTWSKVFTPPMVRGIDGFEVPLSIGFRVMTSFQGKSDPAPVVYVPTWGSHQTPATVMLRSADGVNFEKVSEPGLGLPDPKPRALRGLVPFKGRLFTSPAIGQQRRQPNIAGAAVIYVSSDPAQGNWKLACEPYFGNLNNLTVFQMGSFYGYLYAGTVNVKEGFQIWKTDAEGQPPFKWKKVISHGAYRGELNQGAITMQPFMNHLYIGTGIQGGGFDTDNMVGPAPPEVIRIHPDDSWDLVVGEPRVTPDGLKVPMSGLGPGFGNPFAGYIWSMCVHEGWLYIGNSVWTLFLRYSKKGERWPDVLRKTLTLENIEKLLQKSGGCDLWRSRDGLSWIPVTQNGLDNYFNLGFRTMVSTPYGLFVGTANPFAPEIAVKRVAGWNYEYNPKGGLEVWLGSHRSVSTGCSVFLEETPNSLTRRHHIANKMKENEKELLERLIDQFYGGSTFRHMGFWCEGIDNAKTACENLMDEILAFLAEKKGTIIDIGCGLGATTQYLLKYFSPNAVWGVTNNKTDLDVCQKTVPHVKFVYRKLPKLKVPEESFDFVIWVKGLHQLCARQELIKEAFSILKPGGRLVCFDMLYTMIQKGRILKNIWNFEHSVRTVDEYRDLLLSAGLNIVQLKDVTSECLEGFRKHVGRYFGLKKLSGEIDHETFQNIEGYLLKTETPIRHCLVISGYKPRREH